MCLTKKNSGSGENRSQRADTPPPLNVKWNVPVLIGRTYISLFTSVPSLMSIIKFSSRCSNK